MNPGMKRHWASRIYAQAHVRPQRRALTLPTRRQIPPITYPCRAHLRTLRSVTFRWRWQNTKPFLKRRFLSDNRILCCAIETNFGAVSQTPVVLFVYPGKPVAARSEHRLRMALLKKSCVSCPAARAYFRSAVRSSPQVATQGCKC